MDQLGPARNESLLNRIPYRRWRTGSVLLIVAPVVLLVSVLIANVQRPTITLTLVIAFAVSIAVFVFALTRISRQLHREQRATANALEATEEEFRQMASNIQEIFWMIDAKSKRGPLR